MYQQLIANGVPYKVEPKPRNASRSLTDLIPVKLSIYDVEDVEGFVNDMTLIARIRIQDQAERDEVVSEGIALLFGMAKNFKPQMEGYDKPGKFSGYCAAFLPRKINNAWHKMHPEHVQETVELEDGRKVRRYRYGDAPSSIDSGSSEDGDGGWLNSERIRGVGDFAI